MRDFTPIPALLGGALIGLAVSATLFFTGRVAGISGIVGGLLRAPPGERRWRVAFIGGLLAGGIALLAAAALSGQGPQATTALSLIGRPVRSSMGLAIAGLLVGFGARLGRGCTSGHGVCGISRLSRPSLLATSVFLTTGVATATAIRLAGWFSP